MIGGEKEREKTKNEARRISSILAGVVTDHLRSVSSSQQEVGLFLLVSFLYFIQVFITCIRRTKHARGSLVIFIGVAPTSHFSLNLHYFNA